MKPTTYLIQAGNYIRNAQTADLTSAVGFSEASAYLYLANKKLKSYATKFPDLPSRESTNTWYEELIEELYNCYDILNNIS